MEEKNINLKDLNIYEKKPVLQKQDIILNSAAYIYRNISGYKFNASNDRSEKESILFHIKEAKNSIKFFNNFNFYYIKDIPRVQRQLLIEKKVISPSMAQKILGKGLLLQTGSLYKNKIVAIVINEDEHIKIQCQMSGIKVNECYKEVIKIEKKLEKKLSFSFKQNL